MLIGSEKVPSYWVKAEITSILFCMFLLNELKSDQKLKGNKRLKKLKRFKLEGPIICPKLTIPILSKFTLSII